MRVDAAVGSRRGSWPTLGRLSGPNLARTLSFLILLVYAGLMVASALATWSLRDMDAYLNAANRLLDGSPLYPPTYDPDGAETYRYAPWFAVAWIPMTLIPRPLVFALWSAALILATAYCARRASTYGSLGVATGLILVPMLVITASYGNVQPLLIAALMAWRTPWMVAVAASLKVTPILLASGWPLRRIALAIIVAALLWAPALLWDLSGYPTNPGHPLIAGPLWLHAIVAALLAGAAWRFRTIRPLLAALATVVALPRLHIYDFTFLLAAFPQSSSASYGERE